MTKVNRKSFAALYWIAIGILLFGLLLARTVFAEHAWLSIAIGVLLAAAVVGLIIEKRSFFKTRSAAFGLNSLVTVLLVLSIVGLINFLGYRYPAKKDITRNQTHTLSDQSIKTVKNLDETMVAKFIAREPVPENFQSLLKNYSDISPRFKVDYLDPFKDFAAVKETGVTKINTLLLEYKGKTQKVENVDEESVTNAIIKLAKTKTELLCVITGHGEKDFNSKEADGYMAVREGLTEEAYKTKEVNLPQEGKIPDDCGAIAIIGPTSKIFDKEVDEIERYLSNGGRAIIALDVDIKGKDPDPELVQILKKWSVQPRHTLIIDPLSRGLGSDFTIPVIKTFNKSHAITKNQRSDLFLPLTRHFEETKNPPASLKVDWLTKSWNSSWAETNFAQIASGRVKNDKQSDAEGPLITAVAVSGKQKDSKAKQDTKIVAFGTSLFASNRFMRAGGNLDFFLNAVNWIFEDESSISIRKKGDDKVELSYKQGILIFWSCVVILPVLIAIAGIVFWTRRKRL